MVTVRYAIALAVSKEWSLYQMDVYNAFLQGDLDEEKYMKMPEGFQQKGNHKVYSLLKSLYGLKQTFRQWNIKLTIALITAGFHQSAHDYTLFTLKKLIGMGLELKYVEWNNSFNSWELDLHREILDLYLLSQKWKELVEKAKAKQLQPDEYNSGTLTLSNLGMFGVDRFDVILPPGQGAIMAVGASRPSVVANADGFFNVKNKMLIRTYIQFLANSLPFQYQASVPCSSKLLKYDSLYMLSSMGNSASQVKVIKLSSSGVSSGSFSDVNGRSSGDSYSSDDY
ncbi:hypothetical protein BC332_32160 [Capsicum chinense]|nr:hypothetical protein BC332_32160 [Capsicum chinense]